MTLPGFLAIGDPDLWLVQFLAGESSYVCWAETEGHPKLEFRR